MDFNNDSTRIVVCGKGGSGLRGYEIFSIPDGALLYTNKNYNQEALSCRFSSSNHFAVGEKNGGFFYYASPNTSVWNYTSTGSASVFGVAFTPNGSVLGSAWGGGGSNQYIYTFNPVVTNPGVLSYTGTDDFKAVDYSPDGLTLATGDTGGNLRVHLISDSYKVIYNQSSLGSIN